MFHVLSLSGALPPRLPCTREGPRGNTSPRGMPSLDTNCPTCPRVTPARQLGLRAGGTSPARGPAVAGPSPAARAGGSEPRRPCPGARSRAPPPLSIRDLGGTVRNFPTASLLSPFDVSPVDVEHGLEAPPMWARRRAWPASPTRPPALAPDVPVEGLLVRGAAACISRTGPRRRRRSARPSGR